MEESKERVPSTGGNLFSKVESGIYLGTIEDAHIQSAQSSKAKALKLTIKLESGELITESMWVTNRSGQSFYTKDGQNYPLPDYGRVGSLSGLLVGKEMNELTFTETSMTDRSYGAAAGAMTTVSQATELVGKQIKVAVLKVIEYKQAPDVNGIWQNTSETKVTNTFEKFFDPVTNLTNSERVTRHPASYHDAWLEKQGGKTWDKTKSRT